eukprot:12508983-Alexandrium_andersonii.AAC.1
MPGCTHTFTHRAQLLYKSTAVGVSQTAATAAAPHLQQARLLLPVSRRLPDGGAAHAAAKESGDTRDG